MILRVREIVFPGEEKSNWLPNIKWPRSQASTESSVVTGATAISTDPNFSKTRDSDMVFCSSLGGNVTMAPGGRISHSDHHGPSRGNHVCWNLKALLSRQHPMLVLEELLLPLTGQYSRRTGPTHRRDGPTPHNKHRRAILPHWFRMTGSSLHLKWVNSETGTDQISYQPDPHPDPH